MGNKYKDLKKGGKVTLNAPKVKERRPFAPATKVEKPKKGKGSYNRKNAFSEDEEDETKGKYAKGEKSEIKKAHLDEIRKNAKGKSFKPTKKTDKPKQGDNAFEEDGEDPCWDGYTQKGMKKKNGKDVPNCVKESNASILRFIEAIMSEDHAKAHQHLKNAVNEKIQAKIAQEIDTPLF